MSICALRTAYMIHVVYNVISTGSEGKLIREDFHKLHWFIFIQANSLLAMRNASTVKGSIVVTITLQIIMSNRSIGVVFGAVRSLTVPIFVQTTPIDRF